MRLCCFRWLISAWLAITTAPREEQSPLCQITLLHGGTALLKYSVDGLGTVMTFYICLLFPLFTIILSYSPAVDLWSAGIIFAEMLGRKPFLPGKSSVEQLDLIMKILGNPTAEFVKQCRAKKCIEFLRNATRSTPCSFRLCC